MYKEYQQAWEELTGKGGQLEVEKREVRGEMLRCFKTMPPTLREIWLGSQAFGALDYMVYNQERWTYEVAHAQVASIASWLVDNGVTAGDRVAIAMRNYPEWILSYWAVVSIGAAVVGMNAWWTTPEMLYALEDSRPKVIICDQERLERFWRNREGLEDMQVVVVRARGDMPEWTVEWIDLISGSTDLPDAQIDTDSDACIFYTSGTTGTPKGAQLTHRGCVTNIFNLVFSALVLARTQELQGVVLPDPAEGPQPAGLITTPLFHVTANNCVTHPMTVLGGKLVLMYRWDSGQALQLIAKEKISSLTGVPVMSRELLADADFASSDTSTLLTVGGGGAPLQPDLVAKIDQKVDGAMPSTGYGMTETCGVISTITGELFVDRPASCGRILPTLEAKLMSESNEEVAPGEVGEVWVKGSVVIKGYLNKEEATDTSITDGWLHTGDMGRIDDEGFLYLVDRKKDMVLRGGENIYCAEVENVIFSYSAVSECVVFSVADERLGEEVGVVVVPKEGATIDPEALRGHCREKMAAFKIPRYIWLQDEQLPRNANGKFLKRSLQESLKLEDAL